MRKIMFCIMLIIFCLVGCENNKQEKTETTFKETTVNDITTISGENELSNISEFSGDFEFTFNYDTDCESYIGEYPSKIYTKDGYYYSEEIFQIGGNTSVYGCMLYFYDYASGEEVKVCNKTNCDHDNLDCNAYFDLNTYLLQTGIWLYDGSIYTMQLDEEDIYICKISLDGSSREKTRKIQRQEINVYEDEDGEKSESSESIQGQIHRGYLYYSTYYPGCDTCQLNRIKISGDEEKETIVTIEGSAPTVYRIEPYGRYIFFQMGYYDNSELGVTANLYAFDSEDGNIYKMIDNCYNIYSVVEDNIYFIRNDIVFKYDMESKESTEFYSIETDEDMDIKIFEADEKVCISFENFDDGSINQIIFDDDGNIIDELSGVDDTLYGEYNFYN